MLSRAMQFLHRAPPPALAPFVRALWYWTGEYTYARERILPSGAMQLLINLHEDELRWYDGEGYATVHRSRGAVFSGMFARHIAIDTDEQREIVGVTFKPGGAAPFLPAPADVAFETHVELDALWHRDGAVLRERLLDAGTPEAMLCTLEAVLRARLARSCERDRAVAYALGAFDRGARVGDVTAHLGMTPRRFIQRFSAAVGLTPKRYARVRRFQRVLDALEGGRAVDWARVALANGYFDQAHLIRDFRAFSGVSPTAYAPRASDARHHVPIAE
jgi:AraC-like DNA-binding protein